MDRKSHPHAARVPLPDTRPNPRNYNPLSTSMLACVKSVEKSILAKKLIFPRMRVRMLLKINKCITGIPTKNPRNRMQFTRTAANRHRSTLDGFRRCGNAGCGRTGHLRGLSGFRLARSPSRRNKRKERQKCYHERPCRLKSRCRKNRRIS